MNIVERVAGGAISRVLAWHAKYMETRIVESIPNAKNSNVSVQYPCIIDGVENIVLGNNTTILKNSRLQCFESRLGDQGRIVFGNNCYVGYRFCALAAGKIEVGDDVLIASDVSIMSHNHGMDPEAAETFMEQPLSVSDVSIGNNCWIGDKVIVLPGVSIGNNCVIGGGSVVTKSIPAYSIAVGNPARVIKRYNLESHKWEKI